jgi:hypothetical protein
MTKHFFAAAAASLVVLTAALPAIACTGSTVLFEDDFSFADPAWGNYDGTTIANGQMTIQVEPGLGYTLLNQAGLYQDFDVCIDVVQHNTDPSTAWASLLFWGTDYQNFYAFDVAGNGYVKVSRLQNNRWLSPVDWILTEGLVNPGEEVNHLRVRAVGNVAQVFINGRQVAQFRGQPPEGGGLIGVYGLASADAGASYDFTHLRVTTPDGPIEEPGFGPEDGGADAGSAPGAGGSGGSGPGAPEPGPTGEGSAAGPASGKAAPKN